MDKFYIILVFWVLQVLVMGIYNDFTNSGHSIESLKGPCNCGAFPKTLDLSNRMFSSSDLRKLNYNKTTKCLKMNHDRLQSMDCMDFSTLPKNLTNLCMKDNELKKIKCDKGPIFKHLSHLHVLDVRENAFTLKGLRILLDSVSESSIQKLYLSSNNLNDTVVREINVSFVTNLSFLKVEHCRIKDLPGLFAAAEIFPKLRHLDASNNSITEISLKLFKKFPFLEKLTLSSNPIAYISIKGFSELPLKSLNISYLKLNNKVNTFKGLNISSLQTLDISSSFVFDPAFRNVFNFTTELRKLHMEKTLLNNWSENDLQELFSPLVNLQKLKLSHCNISFIKKTTFQLMTNLQFLDLSNNKVSGWETSCFSNVLSNLTNLDLSDNEIETLNDTSFPEHFVKQLRKLKLHGNSFRCDCSIHWFRTWMRMHYWMLDALTHDNSSRYWCKTPDTLNNTLLVDFEPTYEDCHGLTTAESVATAISAVSFLFILFICKNRKTDEENEIY